MDFNFFLDLMYFVSIYVKVISVIVVISILVSKLIYIVVSLFYIHIISISKYLLHKKQFHILSNLKVKLFI